MSAVSDFLTESTFWWGGLAGTVVGLAGPMIAARRSRKSDQFKAEQEEKMQALKVEQEEKMQARKEEREDKLRDQERLYTAATDFMEVSTDILVTAIDMKGVFNSMRDWFFNRAGLDDPMGGEKMDHAEKVMDAQMRIAVPMNKLKIVAPTNVLDSAMRASIAVMTVVRQTTEPFAGRVAHQAASRELDSFYNVFRQEVGREPYSDERVRDQVLSFMETLKKQVDDYIEEAKADMKAAGFTTTPWDAPRAGSPESGPDETNAEEPIFVGPTPLVPVRSLNVGDAISLPTERSGRTGTVGLLSIIRSFNEERTRMTVYVQNSQKTVTLNVSPDLQFIRIAAAR